MQFVDVVEAFYFCISYLLSLLFVAGCDRYFSCEACAQNCSRWARLFFGPSNRERPSNLNLLQQCCIDRTVGFVVIDTAEVIGTPMT